MISQSKNIPSGINIIIPACGEGRRFQIPGKKQKLKPMIRILDKKMIYYVLDNLKFSGDDNIFILYNNDSFEIEYTERLRNCLKMIKINKKTKGAAETLLEGLNIIFSHYHFYDKTLVVDCDTFYTEDIIKVFKNSTENIVFYCHRENENPIYSYILMNDSMEVTDIREKVKISNYCCTGALGFSSTVSLFKNCQDVLSKKLNHNGEPYTSFVVREMIQKGFQFYGIPLKKVFSLGTPEEVKTYISNTEIFMFDLDGTLVYTDDIYFKIWEKILSTENIILDQKTFEEVIQGNTDSHVRLNLGIKKELKEIQNLKDSLFIENFLSEVRLVKGAKKFLSKIRNEGNKFCVVTNSNRRVAEAILSRFEIIPDFLISSENCIYGKPNGEPYQKALKKYHTNSSKCIVFEDSYSGIVSAKSLNPKLIIGLRTFLNDSTFIEIGADRSIQNYQNLEMEDILSVKKSFSQYLSCLINKNVTVKDEKLKGGFIADVVEIKFDGIDGIEAVLKYDSGSSIGQISNMAEKLKLCEREYSFYQKISKDVNIPIPKCLLFLNDEKIRFGLVFENLFRQGFEVLKVPEESTILKIIDSMVNMHSHFWNQTFKYPDLKKPNDLEFQPFISNFMKERIDHFLKKWSKLMEVSDEIFREKCDQIENIQNSLSSSDCTLVHGDIKFGNIFIQKENKQLCFLDWQHCVSGKGTMDLIFFLIESLNISEIESHSKKFFNYYYRNINEKLSKDGITYFQKQFLLDLENSLWYVPFFTAVWFGTVHDNDLLDKDFPTRFISRFCAMIKTYYKYSQTFHN